jgi:hypothetical protein
MDFSEAEQKRTQLSIQLKQGGISQENYTAAINVLRVTDTSGKIWQPNPGGNGWLVWNGTIWQSGTPPGFGGSRDNGPPGTKDAGITTSLMGIDEFKKMSKDVPLAKRPQRWWDLLSILGGVIAAAIWFLYGGLREGFDVISAVLMIAMPVALVMLRPNIDEILLPLQPNRSKIPRALLIGIGIASPFLTAWILYNLIHISQYPLMQANIVVGTLVSYIIVRDPVLAGNSPRRPPVTATAIGIIICVMLLSAIAVPVMADDCTRDPLNAQDCLRTGGFAEIMAGLVAAVLAGLINGPIILQTFLQNIANSASPASQTIINRTMLDADLQNLVNTLTKQGKFVSNATLAQKAWYNLPIKAQLSDYFYGSERLHCEEAANYGDAILKPLQAQFGKDVKLGQILIERNILMNHTANVIQFPNGEKYIVDVWKSMIDGKPAIYTQADWVKEWNTTLGGTPNVELVMPQ